MTGAIELHVTHQTVTRYSARVEGAYHCAYLTPLTSDGQHVDQHELTIDPPPSHRSQNADAFGNARTEFALYVPHEALTVRAESRLRLAVPSTAPDAGSSAPCGTVIAALRYSIDGTFQPASEFAYGSPYVPLDPELRAYAAALFALERPYLQCAIALMHRIHRDFAYETGVTDVGTPLAQVFAQRRGVCQDFAHLMLAMLRSLGLPARYVSGYLLTRPPAAEPPLLGADASHAWVSVWCPALGWVDLDPTNDVLPRGTHVTVAVGRDYGDVVPLRGVIRGGADHTLEVAVSVVPAVEAPS
jgi:transglutaminase-like putative cysteine protease